MPGDGEGLRVEGKSRAKARRNPSPRKKKPTGMERGMVRFLLVTITSSACWAPRA
jgi:hypothetical protein